MCCSRFYIAHAIHSHEYQCLYYWFHLRWTGIAMDSLIPTETFQSLSWLVKLSLFSSMFWLINVKPLQVVCLFVGAQGDFSNWSKAENDGLKCIFSSFNSLIINYNCKSGLNSKHWEMRTKIKSIKTELRG